MWCAINCLRAWLMMKNHEKNRRRVAAYVEKLRKRIEEELNEESLTDASLKHTPHQHVFDVGG